MIRSTAAAAAFVALAPALALTAPTATAAPSSAAERAAPYRVVASINKTEVVADEETVRITGRVKPVAAGQTVVLQQRAEGRKRWKKSGTATIKRTGKFVLKDDPSTGGVRYYRVLKPAADGLTAGRSRELKLSVWRWRRLADRSAGANQGMDLYASPEFSTQSFPGSFTTTTDYWEGFQGFVEFTLGGKCRTLRASYALTDDSVTGATGTATISVDGVARATHMLRTGSLAADQLTDVTGAYRIRFDAGASRNPDGKAAIGTPEVLCLD